MIMKRERIAKLLHYSIDNFLREHFPLSSCDCLITVTTVKVTPDGKKADVFLSFMTLGRKEEVGEKIVQDLIKRIEEEKVLLKREIAFRLGRKLRVLPEVHFSRDERASKVSRIEELLGK